MDRTVKPLSELHSLDELGTELARRSRARGMFLFWRAQTRHLHRAVVRDGRAEGVTLTTRSGHGMQLVTPEGMTILGSRDDFAPHAAVELLDRLASLATHGPRLGLERVVLPDLPVVREHRLPPEHAHFGQIDASALTRRLIEIESELRGRVAAVQLQLSYRAELDAWRIFRSDGSDVLMAMPRCTLGVRATSRGDGSRHGVAATVFGCDPRLPWDETALVLFLRRAEIAARLADRLPHAPLHPAGSYPLVIDYGMAKGLAHEAFGHGAEADGFRSSILARDGRFRVGESVGAEHVSIIDEAIEGDHAWQPFSANGMPRRRVTLVNHGRLHEALADLWSAAAGGVAASGASRAESYHCAPLPRMSNIRIEVDSPLAAPGSFEDYGPEQVRELLAEAGVLRRHRHVVYLSGYCGGQVNTSSGDFVFHCRALYVLDDRGVTLHRPALFSGSMFGALRAVREGFGPLQLDSVGYCGKWGQSVPSSGGSHYFLALDPDPSVRLGGT